MGNAFVRDRNKPGEIGRMGTKPHRSVGHFDTAAYLTPHSDIVALMALEHQSHMTNLLTRVGWETRLAVHDSAAINKALERPEG